MISELIILILALTVLFILLSFIGSIIGLLILIPLTLYRILSLIPAAIFGGKKPEEPITVKVISVERIDEDYKPDGL